MSLIELNNLKKFFSLDITKTPTQIIEKLKSDNKNEDTDVFDNLDYDKKEYSNIYNISNSNIINNEILIIELLAAQNKKINDIQKQLNPKLNGDIDKINNLVNLLEETINRPILSDFFDKTLVKQDQIAEFLKNIISQKDEQ